MAALVFGCLSRSLCTELSDASLLVRVGPFPRARLTFSCPVFQEDGVIMGGRGSREGGVVGLCGGSGLERLSSMEETR